MINLQLITRNSDTENRWEADLRTLHASSGQALEDLSQFIFVDAKKTDWRDELSKLEVSNKSIVFIFAEQEFVPEREALEQADDFLVYPFRLAEVMSMIKHHALKQDQIALLKEVELAHADLTQANEILERILQAKTPKRYTHLKGLQVMSKHLSGLKPGGDYFDVFESDKKDFVNLLLVDSSTYGISAAFLGMILSSSAKIANDAQLSTADWVRTIAGELKVALGADGHFSVFFGRLNRRDFSLHYQLFGSTEAYIVQKNGECQRLEKQGKQITAESVPAQSSEKVIHLNPKDRLVLLSDGFVNGVGGEYHLQKIFQARTDQEPFAIVNELSFQIKSKLTAGETFPGEDCSAIVIDVESRVLRLAPAS